jgi:hypothetical protein
LPQASSSSRFTAAQAGFFTLIQSGDPTGTVARAKPLRHDPLEAELAGVGENSRAVAFQN